MEQGSYTCVLCKGDRVYTSTRRGVAPLMGHPEEGIDLRGFSAAIRAALARLQGQ